MSGCDRVAGAALVAAPPALRRVHALFLDFDGTLVDIADLPGLVRVPTELGPLLGEIAALLDGALAIVSGRPVVELACLLAPFSGMLVGQHGLEHRSVDGQMIRVFAEPLLAQAGVTLAEFAAARRGVVLEDKGSSFALHFRLAPSYAAACKDIVGRLADASGGGLVAVEGKMVVELVPGGSGKDRAIAALLAAPPFAGRRPIFIGDDNADEDGFAVVDRCGGVSIHVGAGATSARYRLGSASAVRAWLAQAVAG